MSDDKILADQNEYDTELVVSARKSPVPANDSQNMVGQIIGGHYMIVAPLGSGGMSVVYMAQHTLLKSLAAIKVLSPQCALSDTAAMRFQQEAQAARGLMHPNIVVTRDFGLDDQERPFLIMDYIEGTNLDELIKSESDGYLDPERTIRIISQVCAAMYYAHKLGVIHRDIKPGNIVISRRPDGEEIATVVDFGIAKILSGEEGQNLTQTGEIFGSPLYMSPEQCQGKKLDGRSDIYSLGCVMYTMLTGRPPFFGDSAIATLLQHVASQADSLLTSRSGVWIERLDPIVQKCLEKDPNDRYQSMSEFENALKQMLVSPASDSSPAKMPAPKPIRTTITADVPDVFVEKDSAPPKNEQSGRLKIFAVIGVVGVLVFLSIACLLMSRSTSSSENQGTSEEQMSGEVLLEKGEKLYSAAKYQEALSTYDRAENADPKLLWLHLRRAEAYQHLGMEGSAIGDLTKQLEMHPDDPAPLSHAANTLTELHKDQRATFYRQVADCARILKFHPNNANARQQRARLFNALGEPELARLDREHLPNN